MKYSLHHTFLFICLLFCSAFAKAQSQPIPLSNDINNRIEKSIYFSGNERSHTSMRPFIVGDLIDSAQYDSLLSPVKSKDWQTRSWLGRKIFTEHLVEVHRSDFELDADFLPTLTVGKEGSRSLYLNTRGFQVEGVVGTKKLFSFSTYLYENQAKFANYITDFVNLNQVAPGQAPLHNTTIHNTFDYAYSGGTLSFTPSKYLNIQMGYDKNFIGDGYRSLLLSDNAVSYPFIKLTATIGPLRYMAMYAQFTDDYGLINNDNTPFPKKNGIFHYLSWNINKNLNLGLFENVMWEPGQISFSYLNPIIFAHTVDTNNGSPGKSLVGFTGSYKFLNHYVLYGQLAINEFTLKEVFAGTGYWANKQGGQLGLKYLDAFNIVGLNLQTEYNAVRPYTYSADREIKNYGQFNQSLAHPYGANFREYLMIANYNVKRFSIHGQGGVSVYGLDPAGLNYGKNIYLSYKDRVADYGNYIGQGLKTHLYYFNSSVSYLLNPKNNLSIELGYTYRRENGATSTPYNASILSFGIRSSFRNLYYDF
ncbi:hypothetical protein C8P68_101831 [Mucilaginibacter yixingensis]|uniref:Protein involved in gliding motility RemB n=1 Tax=Mucilaginibacter yixingensis TaxID=1295612 RepID=A0A2T5JGV2_9SPHI|nr:hypothetical protein [Mucilaginibacter yixingensis]PTR01596.1 hypothetical protein C8P68_101831 [Mucilaginibacter yixingensis]